MKNKLNLLIIGTGMFCCGRGTRGYGTILPAVFEWSKNGHLGEVFVASQYQKSLTEFRKKFHKLKMLTGLKNLIYQPFPQKAVVDVSAYKKALGQLKKPAAVIIATPDHLHKQMTLESIKKGFHVLVVKPLVTKVNDHQELIAASDKNKVYGAVEFHKRWDLANLKLLQTIQSGRIGQPLYFHVEYSQRKIIPVKYFKKWIRHTNIFQYLGVHYVDIIYFVTKATPVRVAALGQKNWLLKHGVNTEDAIETIIEWQLKNRKEKFISIILTNWVDPLTTSTMSYQAIKVIGTKGRFESDQKKRGLEIIDDQSGIENLNPYFCQDYPVSGSKLITFKGYGIESVYQFLTDVLNITQGLIRPADLEGKRPTFKNTLISTAIIEAVNKSLKKNGKWINI